MVGIMASTTTVGLSAPTWARHAPADSTHEQGRDIRARMGATRPAGLAGATAVGYPRLRGRDDGMLPVGMITAELSAPA